MIGHLTGKILFKKPPQVVIDVNGVGYEIETSLHSFYQLPQEGQTTSLFTHLVVREDAHLLFGFMDPDERSLFRQLIKISGVGPKLALAILSSMTVSQFITCISHEDTSGLVKIPGIGKKTALRLIVEIRDKINNWEMGSSFVAPSASAIQLSQPSAKSDAISALVALGYHQQEAIKAVSHVYTEDLSSETLIREALKGISR